MSTSLRARAVKAFGEDAIAQMEGAINKRVTIKRAETLASHIATHASADALRCALETIDKLANASCDARVFHVAAQVRGLIDSLCESERGEDLPAPATVRSM